MEFMTANGTQVGRVGQGTWYLGEHSNTFNQECKALQAGIEAGMNLIDTAEMYGDGAAEELVGEAIRGYDRQSLYLVSKVYPFNAGRRNLRNSLENSLSRMGTDYLDLYLLHWRGSIPLAETVSCMEEMQKSGLIRNWGVSNLDYADMQELFSVRGGSKCATNQVLYHMGSRGIEYDLLPWMRKQEMPLMAYCPLAQAGSLRRGLLTSQTVVDLAKAHDATPSQILLAFLLAQPGVVPIPRASRKEHTLENAAAAKIILTAEELARINQTFPSPTRKMPLDMQ